MGFDENTHEVNDYYRDALVKPISLEKILVMMNQYKDDGSHQIDLKYKENVTIDVKKIFKGLKGLKEPELRILCEELEISYSANGLEPFKWQRTLMEHIIEIL